MRELTKKLPALEKYPFRRAIFGEFRQPFRRKIFAFRSLGFGGLGEQNFTLGFCNFGAHFGVKFLPFFGEKLVIFGTLFWAFLTNFNNS